MADGISTRRWRTFTVSATCLVALVVTVGGPLANRQPLTWSFLAFAVGVGTVAQFATLRFRQGARTIRFAWGEAALIIVVYLVPAGWVPLVIGVGHLIGASLDELRLGRSWSSRRLINAANLTVAAAAGTIAAHLALMGAYAYTDMGPRLIGALIVGGLAYFVVSVNLLHVNLFPEPAEISLPRSILGTLRAKLPMVAGNITAGIVVAALLAADRIWLLLVPPVVVLMHQAYLYRSRAADDKRIWRDFATVYASLGRHDERAIAAVAVGGALRLFSAAAVEVWVDRRAKPARGYRGTPGPGDTPDVVDAGPPGEPETAPYAGRVLTVGGERVGEIRLWMPSGTSLDARDQMALSAVGDAVAAALHDAAAHRALRALTARSLHDAHHDGLTGLANRTTLLGDGAALLYRTGLEPVCLFVLGINRFKEVNDTLGPIAGDELLRLTAHRLSVFAGPHDIVARIGGDEFAVLSPLRGEDDPTSYAMLHAAALAEDLAVPTEVVGVPVAVEVAVGVVVAGAGEFDMAELVRRADNAMHQAKRGARVVALYDGRATAPGDVERLSVLVDLREALDRHDQLRLAILPTVDLRTGRPIGAEALIRWDHPRRGRLAPADFVDIVDRSDLVVPFTRYVLDRALCQADEWAHAGMPLPVSVNLSPRSLANPDLPGDVARLLKTHNIEPEMLILEITESAVVTGQPVVTDVLAALRNVGVQLAVDDFGSGFSSLTFLTRVQVDEVKVHSSFVGAMTDSLEAAAIVRTSVDLGVRLGVRVVAEGVETEAQRSALCALGCLAAQGRHIAAPVDAAHALGVLRALPRIAPDD